LELRSAAHTFTRIISEGTHCSPYEASIITEKAQEVFQLGVYEERQALQPGQMIWQAIDEKEPPGKPLSQCQFKRIRLTVLCLGGVCQGTCRLILLSPLTSRGCFRR